MSQTCAATPLDAGPQPFLLLIVGAFGGRTEQLDEQFRTSACSTDSARCRAVTSRPSLRGMDGLSEDVIAFLSDGTRTGKLGYVAADGRPLVAPVWFIVDRNQLVFNTAKQTAKVRALSRDSRVVICVDDRHPPYSFVQIQGTASTSEDPDELLDNATRIGGRYMGADRAEEYGWRNGVPGELVVRITPTKVVKGFDIAE